MGRGEQIAWETRQSGTGNSASPAGGSYHGKIGYVHGADLDAAMAMAQKEL